MSQSKLNEVYVVGTIYLAACSYEAAEEDELSFEAGDVLTVLAAKGDSCYQCTLFDGVIGVVHTSKLLKRAEVPLLPMPWFHGLVTRFEVEKLLDRNRPGQFLVRSTQHGKGVFAVSLSCPDGVQHYLIVTEAKTKRVTIDGNNFFTNLPELIEHYKEEVGCLKSRLLDPLGRKGVLDFYVDTRTMKQEWGLSRKAVQFGELLGTGEFGDVFSGTYRGMNVAIKVMKEGQTETNVASEFSREAAILTHLRQKNIVQVVGLLFRGSVLKGIVMEMMGKGSLAKYLSSRGRSVVSPAQLISFAGNVCDGMMYLCQRGFVHRDLAARNVLLNSNGEAKISDLGLARKAGLFVPHEGGKFPIKWTAPEALKYSRFSDKSDVWSFGILLWEIYSYGRVPYPSVSVDDVMQFLEDGNVMDAPEDTPSAIYNIMLSCWHLEPQDRPAFVDLKCMLESFKQEFKIVPSSPSLTSQRRGTKRIPASVPIEALARSPEAATLYSDVLRHNKTVTIYSSNLLVIGPEGSGKTSLLRCFQEKPFSNVEPASLSINIAPSPLEISKEGIWIPSETAFSMEENRLRSVVEELARQTQTLSTPSQPSLGAKTSPPPLPGRNRPPIPPLKAATTDDIEERHAGKEHPDGSPLIRRHSFTGSSRNRLRQQNGTAVNRELHVGNGVQMGEVDISMNVANSSNNPSKLRKLIGSFRRHGSLKSYEESNLITQKTQSRSPQTLTRGSPGPCIVSNGSMDSAPNFTPSSAGYQTETQSQLARNSLPDNVVQGLVYGLEQCQRRSLPPALFGRVMDLPGASVHSLLRSLFFTKRSIAMVTFDLSRKLDSTQSLMRYGSSMSLVSAQNNGSRLFEIGYVPRTYLDHIASDMMSLFHHIPRHSLEEHTANCRMLLVGSHSDKMGSFTSSSKQLMAVKEAVSCLPCKPLLAPSQFVISSSSILEQAKMDELKQSIARLVKTHGRQQVPIQWLEAASEVKALAKDADRIQLKTKVEDILARFCISSEEIAHLLEFFHDNLIVFHLPHIHTVRDVVVIDPSWFAHHASLILSVTLPTNSDVIRPFRQEISLLKSTGRLSGKVITHVWREISVKEQSQLLILLHKMDLLVCLGDQDEVMVLHSHQRSVLLDCPTIAAAVIPALVSRTPPNQLFAEPEYNIEPLYFRIKGGFLPSGLYARLIARCICNYPRDYALYNGLATFAVDDTTTLFVQEAQDSIRIWVQVEEFAGQTPSSPTGSVHSTISTVGSQPISDVCMTVLMFIKAAITDIIQQWIPQLDFDLCVECSCRERDHHYAVLNDTEDWMGPRGLVCEQGSKITALLGVTRWFGSTEEDVLDLAVANDELELATEDDIKLICSLLGQSWWELGEILGFSNSELQGFFATSSQPIVPTTPDISPGQSSKIEEGKGCFFTREDSDCLPNSISASSIASSTSSTPHSMMSTSRLMRRMRQDPFLATVLSIPSHLPPCERLLLQWQSDQGDEATLACLISALELVQRQDIAESLIKSRVEGEGFVI